MNDSSELSDHLDLFLLVKQNAIFESILDCIFDDLLIISKKGIILYISQNTERHLEVNREELIGKPLSVAPVRITRRLVPDDPNAHGILRGHSSKQCEVVIMETDEEEIMAGCRKSFCFAGGQDICKEFAQIKTAASHLHGLKKVITSKFGLVDIIGESAGMLSVKSFAALAALSESTVLLYGESGVGKEMFAHAMHSEGRRRHGSFVKVDCASIPDNLLESELFGYEEGAFTGARKGGKPGKFERAHRGSIFLDEVGDMGLPMQAKLLRVLQDREIERVGGTETFEINVRIIASTRYNLWEKVEKGEFRDDLFYRLEVIPIIIPPLRERQEDIPLLVNYFLKKLNEKTRKEIKYVSEDVMRSFMNYSWPGNVRELENVIEGALNFTDGEIIGVKSLALMQKRRMAEFLEVPSLPGESLREMEMKQIKRAIDLAHGNKREAAKILGIPRSTLYKKLKKT
jgi:transcriptional regulator with PAS, ATPase and Fis domain